MTRESAGGTVSSLEPQTVQRKRYVLCDGEVKYGRCMACFQYVPTTDGVHFTSVNVDDSESD